MPSAPVRSPAFAPLMPVQRATALLVRFWSGNTEPSTRTSYETVTDVPAGMSILALPSARPHTSVCGAPALPSPVTAGAPEVATQAVGQRHIEYFRSVSTACGRQRHGVANDVVRDRGGAIGRLRDGRGRLDDAERHRIGRECRLGGTAAGLRIREGSRVAHDQALLCGEDIAHAHAHVDQCLLASPDLADRNV